MTTSTAPKRKRSPVISVWVKGEIYAQFSEFAARLNVPKNQILGNTIKALLAGELDAEVLDLSPKKPPQGLAERNRKQREYYRATKAVKAQQLLNAAQELSDLPETGNLQNSINSAF